MPEILLTQGKTARVDDRDYTYLNQWHWHAYRVREIIYAQRSGDNNRHNILMHRQLLGVLDGFEVDHIDGDGLNNCRTNLRVCLHQQNGYNRAKRIAKSSVYKGVSWHQICGKWRASIKVNGKMIDLGHFLSEKEAALSYNQAASYHFGEFAKLNVI